MPAILTKRYQCLLGSACLLATAVWKTVKYVGVPKDLQTATLKAFVQNLDWKHVSQVTCLLTLGTFLFDLYRLDPADSSSYRALIRQYIFFKLISLISGRGRKRLEENTKQVQICQEKLLMEILKGAKGTRYAIANGFENMKSVEDFLRLHPLTDYSNFKPYVDRILSGEPNTLYSAQVDYIAATTGTTSGKSKLFPFNTKLLMSMLGSEYSSYFWEIAQMPGANTMKRRIDVLAKFGTSKTETGIQIGPFSGIFDRSAHGCVMPKTAFEITNLSSALYVQMLFGLQVKDVSIIYGPFSSHILSLFKTLEERWDELCFDIQMGRVSESIELPDDIRKDLNKAMKPDRTLAIELRREFQRGFEKIAQRLWPECAIVVCVASGPFQAYTDVVKAKYLGDIDVYSPWHIATEGMYGIQLTPLSKNFRYVITPASTFYEFLPREHLEADNPRTVLAHQVVSGEEYELVVTTLMGLYRYRTNDIIRIVGHYNEAAMYEFVQRRGDNLDLYGEKTGAFVLEGALQSALSKWHHFTLTDYTSTESIHVQRIMGVPSNEMNYVLFIELHEDTEITREAIDQIDECLCNNQEEYEEDRKAGKIQPLSVVQVRSGTFDHFRDLLVASNPTASFQQVKIPRVTRRDEHIKLMIDSAIHGINSV